MIIRDLECLWHDYCMYNVQLDHDVIGTDFENSLYALGRSEKRYSEFNV